MMTDRKPEAAVRGNPALALQTALSGGAEGFDTQFAKLAVIAGHEALCFHARRESVDGSGTLCYSRVGIPLLLEWSAPSVATSFRMEATSLSFDVLGTLFVLPSTPGRP